MKKLRSRGFWLAKLSLVLSGIAILIVLIGALSAYGLYYLDEQTGMVSRAFELPDFNRKMSTPLAYTTTLLDRNGAQFGCFTKEHRVGVSISEIKKRNPQLLQAIIASEDSRFASDESRFWRWVNIIIRPGPDMGGIFRAAVTDIAEGRKVSGGSTIEQQVVKNIALSPERTWSRKIKEAFLAVKLKQHLSRDEILQMYVDLVYLGGPFGIGAASAVYFGKDVSELSLDQSAILAGMINNSEPLVSFHSNDPSVSMRAEIRIKARRDRVLRLMQEHYVIDQEKLSLALTSPIRIARFGRACERREPFIGEMVRAQYEKKFGNLHTGGYQITSTIDLRIQAIAYDACETTLKQYLVRHPENRGTIACNTLVAEIATGEVLALIAGRDFKVREVNGVTYDKDLPGSAFKPFLYATYYEHLFEDWKLRQQSGDKAVPLDLLRSCKVRDFQNVAVPADVGWKDKVRSRKLIRNYPEVHRASYLGEISCVVALAGSENSGTVWAMGQMSPSGAGEARRFREGGDKVIAMAHRLGIKSNLLNFPTVALGFNDVSLWELAEAYLPFINGGCRRELRFVREIKNAKGEIVEKNIPSSGCERVLAPEVASAMRASLQAVVDHPFGTAQELRKSFPKGDLAGKTGTATRGDGSSVVTNLFVGATPRYLIATRVATTDRQVLGRFETGARNALPVFRDIVQVGLLLAPGEVFLMTPSLKEGERFQPPPYDYETVNAEYLTSIGMRRR